MFSQLALGSPSISAPKPTLSGLAGYTGKTPGFSHKAQLSRQSSRPRLTLQEVVNSKSTNDNNSLYNPRFGPIRTLEDRTSDPQDFLEGAKAKDYYVYDESLFKERPNRSVRRNNFDRRHLALGLTVFVACSLIIYHVTQKRGDLVLFTSFLAALVVVFLKDSL